MPGLCPLLPIHTSPLAGRKKGSSQPCCVSRPARRPGRLCSAETSGQHGMLQTWLLRKRLTSHTASLSQPGFSSLLYSSWGKTESIHWLEKQKRERESDSLFLRWWRTAGWPVSVWLRVTTDSAADRWFAHRQTIRTRGQHWDSRAGLRLRGPVFVERVWNPGFSPPHCEGTCAVTLRIGNSIYSSEGKAKIFQPILFLIPNKLVPPAMIIYIDF